MPQAVIETERLILRPMNLPADMDCLWEMDSDPDVMKYIGIPAFTDREAYAAQITKDYDEGLRFKFQLMVTLKDTLEPIGWVIFRPTLNGEWIETGWRLVQRAWGHGYAPEAAGKLVELATQEWGVHKIMAVLEKSNTKSSTVCAKIGLQYRGETTDYYDEELSFWTL